MTDAEKPKHPDCKYCVNTGFFIVEKIDPISQAWLETTVRCFCDFGNDKYETYTKSIMNIRLDGKEYRQPSWQIEDGLEFRSGIPKVGNTASGHIHKAVERSENMF